MKWLNHCIIIFSPSSLLNPTISGSTIPRPLQMCSLIPAGTHESCMFIQSSPSVSELFPKIARSVPSSLSKCSVQGGQLLVCRHRLETVRDEQQCVSCFSQVSSSPSLSQGHSSPLNREATAPYGFKAQKKLRCQDL